MDKAELLYRYFSNTLNKDESEALERLLETDMQFKAQFEFETNLKRVAKEKQRNDLKNKLQNFEVKLTKKRAYTAPYFLKIAASILLLISTIWFVYTNFGGVNYDNLYTSNFEVYPNTVYTITRGDTINTFERQAFSAYEIGNYNLALEKFKAAETKDYFKFYMAQSYLEIKEFKKSKVLFLEIIENNDAFITESKWYLALIAIKNKDKKMASNYLNDLIKKGGYKSKQAKNILKKLN